MLTATLALTLSSAALAADDIPPPEVDSARLQQQYRSGKSLAMVGAIGAPAAGLGLMAGGLLFLAGESEVIGAGLTGLGLLTLTVGSPAMLLAGVDRSNRALAALGKRRRRGTVGWVLLGTAGAVTLGAWTATLLTSDISQGDPVPLTLAVWTLPGALLSGTAYALGVNNLIANERDARTIQWSAWADPRQGRAGLSLTGRF